MNLKNLISLIEHSLSPLNKLLIGLAIVGLITYLALPNPPVQNNTVMITRIDGRSGGSGVIVSSNNQQSEILTNGHVCEVIKNGGIITTPFGKQALAVKYKQSQEHDLCLISVSSKLGDSAKLANVAPQFMDTAIVVGHPHLLPIVETIGFFSGTNIIQVIIGMRKCTDAEIKDPQTGFFCLLVGGFPIVKNYSATLVTATIMAGSSGSAVYNKNNELAGLVFAGSGDSLSYAYTIPYEYVANFLIFESKVLDWVKSNYIVNLMPEEKESSRKKVKDFCSEHSDNNVCKIFKNDMLWTQ